MPKEDKPISLYPMTGDEALEAAMRTPLPKRKPKKRTKRRLV
jgi:hypothetical protein